MPDTTIRPACLRCGGKQSIVVEYPGVLSVEPCPDCTPPGPHTICDTFPAELLERDKKQRR